MSLTFNDILIFAVLLLPGILIESTWSRFLPGHAVQTLPQKSFKYLTISLINFAVVLGPVLYWIPTVNYSETPIVFGILAFVFLVLEPVAAGIAIGFVSQYEFVRKVLSRAGLQMTHHIPTAWDYRFGRSDSGAHVLVTLNDGTEMAGAFFGASFASGDVSERDLYLEQVFEIDDNGNWNTPAKGKGVLITSGKIKFIEFWPGGENDDQEKEP